MKGKEGLPNAHFLTRAIGVDLNIKLVHYFTQILVTVTYLNQGFNVIIRNSQISP